MDTGHSWDPEKKPSGIKDMQPIMVAWWKFENSRHRAFQGVSSLRRGILKKNNRETFTSLKKMAIWTCCTRLFMPRTSSVSTGQSQCGVDRNPEKKPFTRKMYLEIQKETRRRQIICWYSKTTACIGKANAPEFVYEQIWISSYNGEILPSYREWKLQCYKYSW